MTVERLLNYLLACAVCINLIVINRYCYSFSTTTTTNTTTTTTDLSSNDRNEKIEPPINNIRHARRKESHQQIELYRLENYRFYDFSTITLPITTSDQREELGVDNIIRATANSSDIMTTTESLLSRYYGDNNNDDNNMNNDNNDNNMNNDNEDNDRNDDNEYDQTDDNFADTMTISSGGGQTTIEIATDDERTNTEKPIRSHFDGSDSDGNDHAGQQAGQNDSFGEGDDVVTRFLRIVEMQQELGENCTAGTDLNLGEGVVDRYGQERFRTEAEVAVNRANMLSRLWKYAEQQVVYSEYLLHASVLSMVEFNRNIFAAGNCYDLDQYKQYSLFCPYAYRLPGGSSILVKDLAVEYKYLSSSNEWFYRARLNAEKVIRNNKQYSYGFHTYTWNDTSHTAREPDEILSVTYEDGRWSKPYYDCGGGNIWMLTYTVPFFGYKNGSYFFKGTSGIDIDLRKVDIDQCPPLPGSKNYNIFASSDKCKKRTTYCEPIKGLGFRRGSYRCVCKRGYYFGNISTNIDQNYFDGSVIEEEYEKLMLGNGNVYNKSGYFQCLPCAEGCEVCVDNKPCLLSLNWYLRTAILALSCVIILFLPVVNQFTYRYKNVKVVRAASPVLLRVIVAGAFFIYCTIIVMYPVPTLSTCTMKIWFREIGFALTYGALMLKTWRISVIFHVKSARTVKITDADLLKKLAVIVAIFGGFLVVRTLVDPPTPKVAKTTDDLKTYLCETNLWDHWFSIMEGLFLAWGIRLCIVVRKAPSEFNESRFISMAIYNEFLLSLFLNITMLFLQSSANPDLLYIICFCHTQITITLLLCFIFGSKAYMVYKGEGGKETNGNGSGKNIKLPTKYLCKPTLSSGISQTYASTSSVNLSGFVETKPMTAPETDLQEELNALLKLATSLKEKSAKRESSISKFNDLYEYIRLTCEEINRDHKSVITEALQVNDDVDNTSNDSNSNNNINNNSNDNTNNHHHKNHNNKHRNNHWNFGCRKDSRNCDHYQFGKPPPANGHAKTEHNVSTIAHHNIVIKLEDGSQPRQILL